MPVGRAEIEALEAAHRPLKADRDQAKAALDRVHAAQRPPATIAPEFVREFGMLMRTNSAAGSVPFRKAWPQSIVDSVKFDTDSA
ncbi:hypothetical protein [Aquabacter spiritensis]|uniref:Uncharacterized protein n=1 Tax=Aquabacter spiritensis TaxID=933073 RepID=A0A4R3M239_9HYPH|nr:hypothetical protein [Aquabacter spiritensis]TCT06756.1 hypothetical protein EDC64_102236 [Aquabacter spiritensis]